MVGARVLNVGVLARSDVAKKRLAHPLWRVLKVKNHRPFVARSSTIDAILRRVFMQRGNAALPMSCFAGSFGFRAHGSARISPPCRTDSGVNWPRQFRKAGLLRVLLTTSNFWRSRVFIRKSSQNELVMRLKISNLPVAGEYENTSHQTPVPLVGHSNCNSCFPKTMTTLAPHPANWRSPE